MGSFGWQFQGTVHPSLVVQAEGAWNSLPYVTHNLEAEEWGALSKNLSTSSGLIIGSLQQVRIWGQKLTQACYFCMFFILHASGESEVKGGTEKKNRRKNKEKKE